MASKKRKERSSSPSRQNPRKKPNWGAAAGPSATLSQDAPGSAPVEEEDAPVPEEFDYDTDTLFAPSVPRANQPPSPRVRSDSPHSRAIRARADHSTPRRARAPRRVVLSRGTAQIPSPRVRSDSPHSRAIRARADRSSTRRGRAPRRVVTSRGTARSQAPGSSMSDVSAEVPASSGLHSTHQAPGVEISIIELLMKIGKIPAGYTARPDAAGIMRFHDRDSKLATEITDQMSDTSVPKISEDQLSEQMSGMEVSSEFIPIADEDEDEDESAANGVEQQPFGGVITAEDFSQEYDFAPDPREAALYGPRQMNKDLAGERWYKGG